MRKPLLAFLGFIAISLAAGAAQARTVEFLSHHPIPHKQGGGFCYIEVAHVHNYGPSDTRLFREINGQFYFVGDPTPFQYEGPRYSYYGAHPVVEVDVQLPDPVYCYLKGPHYHPYQPPASAQFQLTGGAYWYVGTYPPTFYDDQPRYVVVNEAYAPVRYARPVVDVHAAPVGFIGEISLGGPGFRASAVVGGPVYAPPPPAVQIGVGFAIGGGGPVEYHDHHYGHPYRGPHGGGPAFFGPPRAHHGRPGRVHYDPRQDIARQPVPRATPQRPLPGPRFAPAGRGPAPARGPAPGRGNDRRPPGR